MTAKNIVDKKISKKGIHMKKLILSMISAALASILVISVSAAAHTETTPYNWYCKHKTDGKQPDLDYLLSFTEKSAYFIDRRHGNLDDSEKVVYLTFDAGYENGNVERILDVLKEENVPAAFFILENLTVQNPDLVRRMAAEGHLVCNHTAKHKNMTAVTDKDEFAAELSRMAEAYKACTGQDIAPYYRPPEGAFTELNLKQAKELGYKTIFWSFAYADWDNGSQMSGDAAMNKILSCLHNGEVMLLHPTSKTNADIMKTLISELKSRGFTFGTLDELTA